MRRMDPTIVGGLCYGESNTIIFCTIGVGTVCPLVEVVESPQHVGVSSRISWRAAKLPRGGRYALLVALTSHSRTAMSFSI